MKQWLAANERIKVHFTPASGSWLNLVEVWSGIIERQAIRRGTFTSVRDLNTKSGPSSTAGISAAVHSYGPNPPTRSSDNSNVMFLQTRTTSYFDLKKVGSGVGWA